MTTIPPNELPPNERPAEAAAPVSGEVIRPGETYREPQFTERSTRRRSGRLFWPIMLIIAGLVFLAENTGFLRGFGGDAWDWVLLAAGVVLLGGMLLRAVSPGGERPSVFLTLVGFGLIVLGADEIFGYSFDNLWPVILIFIGAAILLRNIRSG